MWPKTIFRTFLSRRLLCSKAAQPMRSKKPKAAAQTKQAFVDCCYIRSTGGKGGDGCISFLQLWSNEKAGPDGGDGGHGGHVLLQASGDVRNLAHVPAVLQAEDGAKGANRDCHGRNADNLVVRVPLGTIVKAGRDGGVLADLDRDQLMFVAARGGAGGKGNHFFATATEQAPEVCEYGALGESLEYTLEIKSMADLGFIGFPNAGKSTLLRAISRARPKVAAYPFTTLQPHIGIVQYDDFEQIAVADLPGLIEDSHKNRGLGIQFLRHVERCSALVYVLDAGSDSLLDDLHCLRLEIEQFSKEMLERPSIIVANKTDLPGAEENILKLVAEYGTKVVPVSAKMGLNILELLVEMRRLRDAVLKSKKEGSETA